MCVKENNPGVGVAGRVTLPAERWQWSRRPIAYAPASLRLSGAAHRQRSASHKEATDVLGTIYHRPQIVSQYSLDYDSVSTINSWRL